MNTEHAMDLDFESLNLRTEAFIDGSYRPAQSRAVFETIDPATGKVLAKISRCDSTDVDLAVSAARRVFESGDWREMPPCDRKRILIRFSDLIDSHRNELALLETLEVGKPIRDSLNFDIPKAANLIRWNAEALDKLYGEVAPTPDNTLAFITREPLGVVGAVIAWNFPLYLAAYKLGPALASGNSVVLKPAEQSSLTALRIAELASEAGLPDGVLNVVPGLGEEAGRAIGLHNDIDCVSFTGSTEIARRFHAYSAQSNMKRVFTEAGGKSANIVLSEAIDLDKIAEQAVWGVFFNQGQICSAGSRLIVEEAIKDVFVERIVAKAKTLIVGNPLDDKTDLGALIDGRHLARIEDYVSKGLQEGASLLLGGSSVLAATGGFFFEPTIFEGVKKSMTIAREEVFGPVLSIMTCHDADEAVALANDTIYGLGAAVWTRDINTALRVARKLRAGQVWVNSYDAADYTVPWGGFKQSGNGCDKSLHAFENYTALKATWIDLA